MEQPVHRFVIIEACQAKKCRQECRRSCPIVRLGRECVVVTAESKAAVINEKLCIGCGICVKKCPFNAIRVVNLPPSLAALPIIHRQGANTFALLSLPIPAPGQVLGLVGGRGSGKSTAIRILAGKLKPNLGSSSEQSMADILKSAPITRDPALAKFYSRLVTYDCDVVIKPQYIDMMCRVPENPTIGALLNSRSDLGSAHLDAVIREFDLQYLLTRHMDETGGGELQRIAIAACCVRRADIYLFDEFSAYLDIKQRHRAARAIRNLLRPTSHIVAADSDLGVVESVADSVCCMQSVSASYGAAWQVPEMTPRVALNAYLTGAHPELDGRFRDVASLSFTSHSEIENRTVCFTYPRLTKTHTYTNSKYVLNVEPGTIYKGEIIGLLGENGIGKTTFLRLFTGLAPPDDNAEAVAELSVSYKPQKISPTFHGTVRELFEKKAPGVLSQPQFLSDIYKPLRIDTLDKYELRDLSGSALQRVALALKLGTPAKIYLIDEPFAYLDSEERIIAAHIMRNFINRTHACLLIVEHDLLLASYLANRVILFEGRPSDIGRASAPQPVLSGFNSFLRSLDLTAVRDITTQRLKVNRIGSARDKAQKEAGQHFVTSDP